MTVVKRYGAANVSERICDCFGEVLDYDEANHVIGIEIEDASLHMDLSKLEISALPLVDLVMKQTKIPALAT
ncbi:MAG: DUF2283 domain-containing protein [Caldilineaceae bacterium]|nr:DUF2283 domain-containing protein [Caldilineaceae bacterium]